MLQSKSRSVLRTGGYRLRSYRWLAWLGGTLAVLLFLGVGVAWALGYFSRDPRLVEIDNMRADMAANGAHPFDPKNRDLFNQLKQKVEQLPQDLRDQARDDGDRARGQFMQQEMTRFFTLSREEQNAELDKRIKDMQAMMKQWQSGSGGNGTPGGGPGGSSGGGPATGGSTPPKGGPGGWRSLSPTDRLAKTQSMIDTKTTAQGRAQFHLFMQMMQQRAAQTGVAMPSFGPR